MSANVQKFADSPSITQQTTETVAKLVQDVDTIDPQTADDSISTLKVIAEIMCYSCRDYMVYSRDHRPPTTRSPR